MAAQPLTRFSLQPMRFSLRPWFILYIAAGGSRPMVRQADKAPWFIPARKQILFFR